MVKWWCHGLCLFFVILHLQANCSRSSSSRRCSPEESSVLLQFRRGLSISSTPRPQCRKVTHPVADNWVEDTDCCSWYGVTCHKLTGHVIGLDLSCHWLQGNIPFNSSLFQLSHLQHLNLAHNDFNHSQISTQLANFKQLKFLDLSYSNFSGHIPDVFGNLSKLEELHLNYNNFSCQLPFSIFNLTGLQGLELQSNQLFGHLPCHVSASGLLKLNRLDLGQNKLSGKIPSWLFTLPSLQFLDLSHNDLSGPIDQFEHSNSVLKQVYLADNKIHGAIPSSIFELVNLTDLDLFSNNLSGVVDWNTLQRLKNLRTLDLSYNKELSLTTSSDISFSLPNLEELSFSSCNVSEFPHFLRTLESLTTLYLSNNKIKGQILGERGEWPRLSDLDLSHNYLTGLVKHPWKNIQNLDLSFNFLQGTLPDPPPSLNSFMISNNNLVGQIPSSFCNLSSIDVLDLSNNGLSGVVPQCFGNFGMIRVLNLRNNNFNGSIPSRFAKGSRLMYLNLNGNRFAGKLPRSLLHCSVLQIIDVGNNQISDAFPHWLEALSNLLILILRSNNFHGTIGHPLIRHPFQELRILDLSHNAFTGVLPSKYLQKLKILMDEQGDGQPHYIGDDYFGSGDHYQDFLVVDVVMKGLELEMKNILTIFTTIDFSHNQFEGQIPEEVGLLKSIVVLNFSHNNLVGHIPFSLGNLTEIESLDLSSNKLIGEIPWQLTELTFLEVLNLSRNQLTGEIPRGRQFDTFGNDSYLGNSGLCGPPLVKKCNNSEAPEQAPAIHNEEEEDSTSWFDWKIAMMGYGCGLVFGISIAYIVFTTGEPWWFVKIIERQQCKIEQRANQRPR